MAAARLTAPRGGAWTAPPVLESGLRHCGSRASYLIHRAAREWRSGFAPGAKIDPTKCAVLGNATESFGRRSYAEGVCVYGWGFQKEVGAFCSVADKGSFVVGRQPRP